MGILKALWQFLLISSPYLLLGLFVAGLVHTFLNANKIKSLLGGGRLRGVFYAAIFGVPLPLCSCSVLPTAVTLRKSGASTGATSSFLIATPESGIDSIAVTYALMDFPMTIFRPVAAFLSAFVAGILNMFMNNVELEADLQDAPKSCCSKGETKQTESFGKRLFGGIKYGFLELSADIAFWLTVGLLAGACISYFVPDNFFMNMSAWQNKLMILVIGVPLYICASATTPIAAAMVMKGLTPGAALLLLLVGPATNISNIAVIQKYIGKKGVIINIASIVLVALTMSFVADYFYATYGAPVFKLKGHMHQHEESSMLNIISAVAIIIILARGLWIEEIKPRISKEADHCHDH
jgi:uncharacterized membrane protein YraQ (UPF0718 family)